MYTFVMIRINLSPQLKTQPNMYVITCKLQLICLVFNRLICKTNNPVEPTQSKHCYYFCLYDHLLNSQVKIELQPLELDPNIYDYDLIFKGKLS